jgi:hypothetical protein
VIVYCDTNFFGFSPQLPLASCRACRPQVKRPNGTPFSMPEYPIATAVALK